MSAVASRILTATIEAASIHGIGRLSLSDVAKRAGLSRPTVYKHFPSKDALVEAAVQREITVVLEAVLRETETVDDPKEALTVGLRTALLLAREHPLLDRVVRTEPERLVPLLATDDGRVLALLRPPIEEIISRKLRTRDQVVVRRLADTLVRLVISYALNPPDDPPEVVVDVLLDVIFSGVDSMLAEHP